MKGCLIYTNNVFELYVISLLGICRLLSLILSDLVFCKTVQLNGTKNSKDDVWEEEIQIYANEVDCPLKWTGRGQKGRN